MTTQEFADVISLTERIRVTTMDDIREAHPASWYIAQGIKDVEQVPETYRDMVSEGFQESEDRLGEMDQRIRALDAKYNQILGVMHDLGSKIEEATKALVAHTKQQNA
jgi:hypothetical protein